MNLENNIKDVITKKLEDGTIERIVSEQLEKSVSNALEDLFRSYGDVTKVIKDKVKSVMVPYLEGYDYSKYITKLDSVLVDILEKSTLDNRKILENFKELMSSESIPETIKISDIYEKWCEYCKENVDEDNVEFMDYEGRYINVNLHVEEVSGDWNEYEKHVVTFTCEEDEDLNVEFMITKWKEYDDNHRLDWDKKCNLKSLKFLNKFDMFMMNLDQACTDIILDKKYSDDELFVEPEY